MRGEIALIEKNKPLSAKRLIVFLAFAVAGLRVFANTLPAQNGFIDAGNQRIEKTSLKGQWLYFPDTLIAPANIEQAQQTLTHWTIDVPTKRQALQGSKYGTYYLRLTTPALGQQLIINSLTIYSAAHIYVDGQLTGAVGNPGNSLCSTTPGLMLNTYPFTDTSRQHRVVVHYANFFREKDGIANSIYLTTPQVKLTESVGKLLKYAIILGTILFIIFNQINYFFLRKRNVTSLYFGIAAISIFIYILFMSQYYMADIFPKPQNRFFTALYLWRSAYYATVCFFVLYVHSLFPAYFNKWALRFAVAYCLYSAFITWIFPLHFSSINFNFFMMFTLIISLYSVATGVFAMLKNEPDARLFVFGFGFFIATVTNDILHNLLIIKSVNLLDVGIFGLMLTQAQIINSKLNRYLSSNDRLAKRLQFINTNLEDLVKKRTQEIEEQKAEIEAQRDEILAQRDYAENQHRLIARQTKTITDSINYAREIQMAVLPDERRLQDFFTDSFILYQPKDYVSGDFYWMSPCCHNNQPHIVFCVADCTGHGVPGALLSMLGMSLLNEITSHNDISDAGNILNQLQAKFKTTLANNLKDQQTGDGMHMTLCVLNKANGLMSFAGAYQSLFHFRGETLTRLKGTRCIIGNYLFDKPFEQHTLQLEKGDRLYLFTDGFSDQMSSHSEGRFMQKRLTDMLAGYNSTPGRIQKQLLLSEFIAWKGTSEQIDDVLVMGVRY